MHDLEMTWLVPGVRLAFTHRSVYRLCYIFLCYLNNSVCIVYRFSINRAMISSASAFYQTATLTFWQWHRKSDYWEFFNKRYCVTRWSFNVCIILANNKDVMIYCYIVRLLFESSHNKKKVLQQNCCCYRIFMWK